MQTVAVVGAGISGIIAAYLLSRRYQVTLFEKNDYVGGHTSTVVIPEGPDAGLAVDTGFIVMNDKTYPTLHRFLAELQVPVRFADMSFSLFCKRSGLQWGSRDLNMVFADRRNCFSPRFLKMLFDITRFWRAGKRSLQRGEEETPLGVWLERNGLQGAVVEDYIAPISGAIWSSPLTGIYDFPVGTFLHFYQNHGLLSLSELPRWQTVVGGSFQYVKRFLATFQGEVVTRAPVDAVTRDAEGVTVRVHGSERRFDHVVLALHPDEARGVLRDPSPDESVGLAPWSYQANRTVLHTDTSFLPANRRAWSSWNFIREASETGREPVSITYDMSNLQGLSGHQRYLVTLNPRRDFSPGSVIREFLYTHPIFTPAAVAGRERLRQTNGVRRTWFCGAYFGFGFHEDGAKSGVEVARGLGVSW